MTLASLLPQEERAVQELDQAMTSPEAMAAVVDTHKLNLVFHLWDPNADGIASREWLSQTLDWYYRRVALRQYHQLQRLSKWESTCNSCIWVLRT